MAKFKQKLNTRTGQFNLVNDEGLLFFKNSVANVAALPVVGNNINDARIVLDTYVLYVWSGTAWIYQGDVLNIDWSTIENKPSSAVGDIDDAVNKKHSQNTDLYLATVVTNTLYVDGNRSDIYTPNGSITKPFKKIQDAIDAVTSPSATNKYLIEIAPGAYYSDALAINKIYVTFRSCGVQGARISGAITVTNPSSPTPEQITFIGLRISGGLTCLASHIAINCIDCNVTGSAWIFNPGTPTDDEYLQIWGGLWYANATLTNVYTYIMGGGLYSTFVATNKEFNINNADINTPFQVTLNGTIIGSAYGNRTGNSNFILNAGSTIYMDADTEGGSVITLAGGTLIRTTKAANIVNVPAGTIVATDVQAAINELDGKTKDRVITITLNNGDYIIPTGIAADLEIPYNCTVLAWTLLSQDTGSITVDVWKDSYANFPPTDADSMPGAGKELIISASNKAQDIDVTDWAATSIVVGDILRFNVDSCSSIKKVTVSLKVRVV